MVQLGDRVRDKVTGLEGVAIGRAVYLFGCSQVCVAPRAESAKVESFWFDEPRLEVTKAQDIPADSVSGADPGGPGPSARRSTSPPAAR